MPFLSRVAQVLGLLVIFTGLACSQDLEPRAYSNLPIGLNFSLLGLAYSRGDILVDPSLPVENAESRAQSALMGYSRSLGVAGKSAQIAVTLPYTHLSAQADILGQTERASVSSLSDPSFAFTINLLGAPALSAEEFKHYVQKTIVGVSLTVTAPWGQYDGDKVVNLGGNRWVIEPEVGISRKIGPWLLEGALGLSYFTDNPDYLGGARQSQSPIASLQGHVIYTFANNVWISANVNYFSGGTTRVDGEVQSDKQNSSRWGLTLALPVDRRNSIKLYASRGLFTRRGGEYDLLGIGWQRRWGGGTGL